MTYTLRLQWTIKIWHLFNDYNFYWKCEQHFKSLLPCLWFLFVSHLSNFLSHPSVPEPTSLVNKRAPEKCREPATSWKSEATRLTRKMLSFQEGMSNDLGFQLVLVQLFPLFSSLLPSPLSQRAPSCAGAVHPAFDMCLRTSCVHKAELSQASSPALRRMPVRKLSYLENVKYSILMELFFTSLQKKDVEFVVGLSANESCSHQSTFLISTQQTLGTFLCHKEILAAALISAGAVR